MKFHQVRLGARFYYRGSVFRKISPLKASREEDDSQKLIPRSGEVALLNEQGGEISETLPETLAGSRVEAAVGRFLPTCERAAAQIEPALTESQRTQLQRAISAACQDLLLHLARND